MEISADQCVTRYTGLKGDWKVVLSIGASSNSLQLETVWGIAACLVGNKIVRLVKTALIRSIPFIRAETRLD